MSPAVLAWATAFPFGYILHITYQNSENQRISGTFGALFLFVYFVHIVLSHGIYFVHYPIL